MQTNTTTTPVQLHFSQQTLADMVDQYAALKAQIANMQEQEALMRAALISTGLFVIEGNEHRVTVSEMSKRYTDWRAVAENLKPSRQLVTAHTRTTEPTFTVRVYGRKTV